MELDALRESWVEYDRKLDASLSLNRRVLAELQTRRVARPMLRLQVLTWLHVAAWIVMLGALGSFLAGHWGEWRFVLPCLLLQLYGVGNIVALGQTGVAAAGVNERVAVVEMQRRIAHLRVMRLRYLRWSVGAGAALGMAWMVVTARALLGIDLVSAVSWRWMALYSALSALAVPATLWVCARFFRESAFLRNIVEDLGGWNLRQARLALAELEEFAR